MKRRFVLILAGFFFLSSISAQDLAGALASFRTWSSHFADEKVFVHTDKGFYLTGEIIWFKVYNVDADSHRPLPSKVAYVEVLDSDHKPILQAKIALTEGSGGGSLLIPHSLSTGNYLMRSYTSWMKNFDTKFFFEKAITIVNPQKNSQQPKESSNVIIRFFPEGGDWVRGISSRIAFHSTDATGRNLASEGFILNKNDTLLRFSSNAYGMGSFVAVPTSDSLIAVVTFSNGQQIRQPLPLARSGGYAMEVKRETNKIRVFVRSSQHHPVFLIAHRRQKVYIAEATALRDGSASFEFDLSNLSSGVNFLTLFDENHRPVAERLVYIPPRTLRLKVSAPSQIPARSKVEVSLTVQTPDGDSGLADLSAAVYQLDSLQGKEWLDINTYLHLTSDLATDVVPFPSALQEDVDLAMLIYGWRRFQEQAKPSFDFLPEYEGHIVRSRILNGHTDSTQIASLSTPGNRFVLSHARSDRRGHFHFVMRNMFGPRDLILQAPKNAVMEIMSPFDNRRGWKTVPLFLPDVKWKDLIVFRNVNTQTQNAFHQEAYQRYLAPPVSDTTNFYGIPDKRYMLDDYTRFGTMEEVMREYVSEVRVRKDQGAFKFDVLNTPYKLFFHINPLVLLDGVPVASVDRVMGFDPLKIKSVEVIARRHHYGPLQHHGIVSLFTYEGNLGGLALDPGALIVQYEGLQLQREFPAFDSIERRIPDFRNVLFWQPHLTPTGNGAYRFSFNTSDLSGQFLILVQGVSADGITGSASTVIEVKPNVE